MSDTGLFANDTAAYGSFKTPGTTYSGTVISTSKTQATKYVPKEKRALGVQGEPEMWPDGRPKYVSIITVQTDQRDPSIPGDNGARSLWIKGKQMEDAAKKAVRESGAAREGIVVGGWFSMTFTSETPSDWGGSAAKNYTAEYRPPAPGSVNTEIVAGPANTGQADPWASPGTAHSDADPWNNTKAAPPAAAGASELDNLPPETRALVEKMLHGGNQ